MSILTVIRAIKFALVSTGLLYTILMIKGAVSTSTPPSYVFLLISLEKIVSIFRSWLSSPFYICILMNFIVILIAVSSLFHHPRIENNSDNIEDGGGGCESHDDSDLHSALSPLPPPPPMQRARKKRLPVEKTTTAKTSLKNEEAVFSDFSRLTKAKDIRKGDATTEQGSRDINVAEVPEHFSVQAIFDDLPKFGEPKEIKMSHSVDSSRETKTIQNPMEESRNENQNQTEKQHEKNEDDWDEDDTMEATWRVINGGTKPQEKQLKKSETWPQPQKFITTEESEEKMAAMPIRTSGGTLQVKELRKSMTFNDTVTIRCRGGLRRDPSMNLEELNQRVESFIQKFNHEMRLQRQESEQRYLDLIGVT